MCAENPINTVSAHRAIATVVSGYDSLTLGRVVVENLGISGNQVFADSPAKAPTRQARPQHDRSGRPELWAWKRVRPYPPTSLPTSCSKIGQNQSARRPSPAR